MPTPEEVENQALARMYRAIREAKEDSPSLTAIDYMAEVAEQVAAKSREHRGKPGGGGYGEFAEEVANLAAKLAELWTH